jgi:hypothetical protein
MARYSRSVSRDVKGAIKRRKADTLKSGKSGKTVKSKKQAAAIRLSEARAKGRFWPLTARGAERGSSGATTVSIGGRGNAWWPPDS